MTALAEVFEHAAAAVPPWFTVAVLLNVGALVALGFCMNLTRQTMRELSRLIDLTAQALERLNAR